MKLNEEQINAIDLILEQSGVVYVDYKFEILDHIATQVEELMVSEELSFENSLEIILKKWEPKFKKSASATFGYIWELPEILTQKAKKIYWRKMILLIVLSFILMLVLLFAKEYLAKITEAICYLLASLLFIQGIGYFKIRMSRQKTTYGFLYKQQFLAFFFMYLLPIHLLTVNEAVLQRPNDTVFPVIFGISLLIIAPILNFRFYKNHFEQLSKHNKLVY